MRSSRSQFFRLLSYALPYKRQVAIQFLCMAATVAMGLLKPWPLKILIDNVAGQQPLELGSWRPDVGATTLLALACIAYLLIHAGESLIQLGGATAASLTTSKMIRDLRADVVRSLQAQSLKFHDRRRVGDDVHRVTYGTMAVETAYLSGFMGFVKSCVTLVSMFVIMLTLNVRLTLIALAVVPLLLIVIRWYAKRIHVVSLRHQEQEGSLSSRTQEILSSIRLIKAFTREGREQERFDDLSRQSVKTRVSSGVIQNAFGFVVSLVLALGTALLFWFGFSLVRDEKLTLGEFLVFNAYLTMLYAPLSVLSYTASSVQAALGGGSRIFEVLDAEVEIKDQPGAHKIENVSGAITFEDVHFGYEAGQTVLDGISFTVNPGETLAIVGETGGGKSTLLSLILRFYEPSNGRILLDGRDTRSVTLDSLRRSISLVPQESVLLSDSIRENIAYGRSSAGNSEIEDAARAAEAHDFIIKTPKGYDTVAGERGVRLSVGQRQRIALARALLKDAPIVLFDEPTSALDAETEGRLWPRIEQSLEGQTVILVAHRLSTVRNADRILVLSNGKIVESGSHDELMALGGVYARMWRLQTAGQRTPLLSEA